STLSLHLLLPLSPSTLPSSPHTSTLSLHDALPIYHGYGFLGAEPALSQIEDLVLADLRSRRLMFHARAGVLHFDVREGVRAALRSEEHTSELQSHLNLVCRLLLVKIKMTTADTVSN